MATSPEKAYKYDEATIAVIEEAILMGANNETAAMAAGIKRDTFQRWMRDIPEFNLRINQARAKRAVSWLKVIEASAAEHWQAAAWKLERTDPKQFGRRVAMEIVDSDGNTIDPDQLRSNITARLTALYESEEAE